MYEGTLVSAQEALTTELVDFVVPAQELRAQVQSYAAALAQKPKEALAAIRRCINAGEELSWQEGLAVEASEAVRLAGTGDFAEGVRAFLEKRHAQFE